MDSASNGHSIISWRKEKRGCSTRLLIIILLALILMTLLGCLLWLVFGVEIVKWFTANFTSMYFTQSLLL